MKESMPHNWSTGKARRVSHQRELAVVTLAAVASISGVGGLLAVGKQASAPIQSASVSRSTLTSPAQPRPAHNRWPSGSLPTRVKALKGRGTTGRSFADPLRRPVPATTAISHGRPPGTLVPPR